MKPQVVNILGKSYTITYCDSPVDVDRNHETSLWGCLYMWSGEIRIYKGKLPETEILQSLIHEILHAISFDLKLELRKEENHDELDLLALALADTLTRNGWLKEDA